MIFTPTRLPGVYLIDLELREDERGFFARTWCQREAAAHGIHVQWVQCNLSYNRQRGTLRGMHYQTAPYAEGKLVCCTRGAMHDVVIDLRPESPVFRQHLAVTFSAEDRRALYIPPADLAHGFLTLADDTEVFYQMSEFYTAEHAAGVRWDDPAFAIRWPAEVRVVSARDQSYPDFDRTFHPGEQKTGVAN
jgi:dTDP-4-dehydrorhamnose 3,5-epimerase